METAGPANTNIARRRGGTPFATKERKSSRKKSRNSLKIDERRKLGPLQMARLAATGWAAGFDSPVSCLLAASSAALPPSDSNRNNSSFKNVRNRLSPNEKAFSNRNSNSHFPHSQPPSVKLAPLAPARVITAAGGRAGLQSRGAARNTHGASALEAATWHRRTQAGVPRPCAPRLGRNFSARCKP